METGTKQRQVVKAFVKDWMGKGYEKGETQRFWLDLLHRVFGIDNPMSIMQFEIPVKTITKEKGSDFIDAYISSTKVLIEQKGSHIDLSAKARQSDGAELTPYQQGRRYAAGLPVSMTPRWIVACNFTSFEVHDMEHPNDAPEIVLLQDLEKNSPAFPSWSMIPMSISRRNWRSVSRPVRSWVSSMKSSWPSTSIRRIRTARRA